MALTLTDSVLITHFIVHMVSMVTNMIIHIIKKKGNETPNDVVPPPQPVQLSDVTVQAP